MNRNTSQDTFQHYVLLHVTIHWAGNDRKGRNSADQTIFSVLYFKIAQINILERMYPLLNIKNEPKLTALILSFKAELFIFPL